MRFSISHWPFFVKIGVPCALCFVLAAGVEIGAIDAVNHLNRNLQDIVHQKFNASIMLADTVERLRSSNGDLYLMQVKAAAEIKQDVERDAKKIVSNLETVIAELEEFKTKYADAEDISEIETVEKSVKSYKDGVYFVSSMLDIDFKSTATFIVPLADNYGKMVADLKKLSTKILESSKADADAALAETEQRKQNLYIFSAALLSITLLLAWLVIRATVRSINGLTTITQKLSEGDTLVDIDALARKDELGQLVNALGVFRENIIRMEKLQAEQAEVELRNQQTKKQMLSNLATNFEASVGKIVSELGTSASDLQRNAASLTSTSQETSQLSVAVASATEEASASVATVASASEELSASIEAINQQVATSRQIALEAVEEVKTTNTSLSALTDAAAQIGDVMQLIQNIAGQTNLLALNATIEAARAGEAGKGFAVVANEVKALATQTGKATQDIAEKIQVMQDVSATVIQAVQSVSETVERINSATANITEAVQQQKLATQEISSSVQSASSGTSSVTADIVSVKDVAERAKFAANEVLEASNYLSKNAQALSHVTNDFILRMKNQDDAS